MRLGHRRLAAVALTTALLAAPTACGSDEDDAGPLADTSKSASPSPSESPGATPPAVPAAAEDTEKARKAFARWFVDAFAYAFATNDPSPIMEVAATKKSVRCATCDAFAEYLEERKADDGLVVEPSTYEIKELYNTGRAMEDVWVYVAITNRPAYANVTEDGTVRDRQRADSAYPIEVGLRWGTDGYEITGWTAGEETEGDG